MNTTPASDAQFCPLPHFALSCNVQPTHEIPTGHKSQVSPNSDKMHRTRTTMQHPPLLTKTESFKWLQGKATAVTTAPPWHNTQEPMTMCMSMLLLGLFGKLKLKRIHRNGDQMMSSVEGLYSSKQSPWRAETRPMDKSISNIEPKNNETKSKCAHFFDVFLGARYEIVKRSPILLAEANRKCSRTAALVAKVRDLSACCCFDNWMKSDGCTWSKFATNTWESMYKLL